MGEPPISLESSEVIENPSASASGGAGIRTAQIIANSGVEAVIASSPGPNAFEVLNELGIKIYRATGASVEDNIRLFTEGNLEEIRSAGSGRGRRGR